MLISVYKQLINTQQISAHNVQTITQVVYEVKPEKSGPKS